MLKIMKKLLILVTMMTIFLSASAQISTCSWHDGYWGQWKSHSSSVDWRYNEYSLYGNFSGFIIYKKGAHPSEFIFKFETKYFTTPDKKTIKSHLKNNTWYEYSGTVEYYVTEEYPTIAAILKAYEFPHFNCNSGSSGNPCVKRTANATIKIAPYKKQPKCYNIFFDGVAVGIDMENTSFDI